MPVYICTTPDCENAGVVFDIPDSDVVICGPCGTLLEPVGGEVTE